MLSSRFTYGNPAPYKGYNTQHSGQISQNEVMVEIYSNSLVGAIGKVLRMEFSQNTNLKTNKGDRNGLFNFFYKQ